METADTGLDEPKPLTVYDLPQLHLRPLASDIRLTLDLLNMETPSFGSSNMPPQPTGYPTVLPDGVPGYLTNIIASPLAWIEDEDEREEIRELASKRLTERSGRTGMAGFTQRFAIPTIHGRHVDIVLNEPAFTGDNLGHKTWGASFVLAKNLHKIDPLTGSGAPPASSNEPNILELGAGTGLVGLAAAIVWHSRVFVTDLPEIEPNLAFNIGYNKVNLGNHRASVFSGVLDWSSPGDFKIRKNSNAEFASMDNSGAWKAKVILVSDPLYSRELPRLLVQTISTWLEKTSEAKLIVCYPLRGIFGREISDLRNRLETLGLRCTAEEQEAGNDDWVEQVQFVWGIWQWTDKVINQ